MEERYHVITQNLFYPDMSNVNKNITVEALNLSAHLCINYHYTEQYQEEYIFFITPHLWFKVLLCFCMLQDPYSSLLFLLLTCLVFC
jgi:hypothetical protein